jgi:hypothetical protein
VHAFEIQADHVEVSSRTLYPDAEKAEWLTVVWFNRT